MTRPYLDRQSKKYKAPENLLLKATLSVQHKTNNTKILLLKNISGDWTRNEATANVLDSQSQSIGRVTELKVRWASGFWITRFSELGLVYEEIQ